MRSLVPFLALLALAACGADGEPETPTPPPSGMSVTIEYGVSGSF